MLLNSVILVGSVIKSLSISVVKRRWKHITVEITHDVIFFSIRIKLSDKVFERRSPRTFLPVVVDYRFCTFFCLFGHQALKVSIKNYLAAVKTEKLV